MDIEKNQGKRSSKIGIVNALKASFSFSIMYFVFVLVRNLQDIEIMSFLVLLVSSIILFLGGGLIAMPIGYLAGLSMFDNLKKESGKKVLEVKEVEKKGRIWGALLGLMLSVFLSLIVFRRGDMVALIFYFTSAIFFASFFGGLAARQIIILITTDAMDENIER